MGTHAHCMDAYRSGNRSLFYIHMRQVAAEPVTFIYIRIRQVTVLLGWQ